MPANRETFAALEHGGPTEIYIPEIGQTVFLRTLKFGEWASIAKQHQDAGDAVPVELMAKTVAMTLCHEDGTRIYGADETDAVLSLPWNVAAGIYRQVVSVVFGVNQRAEAKKD
jgi:hypothetical protein